MTRPWPSRRDNAVVHRTPNPKIWRARNSKKYQPNGAREIARRERQAATIYIKQLAKQDPARFAGVRL